MGGKSEGARIVLLNLRGRLLQFVATAVRGYS